MTDPARTLDAPVILIDHQEKTPWAPFVLIKGESWLLPTERAHLGTGDYAIKGLERYARIERKARDLYSTLFGRGPNTELGEANQNQDRFRRELIRFADPRVLEPGALQQIWIEGTMGELFERRGVHDGAFHSKEPWEVYNLIEAIALDYGVDLQFVGGPRTASLRMGTIFRRIYEQATDPKAAKKAATRGVADSLPWIGRRCFVCGNGARAGDGCEACGMKAAGDGKA